MKTCPKCKVPLIDGVALDNSYGNYERYVSPYMLLSNGELVKCLKCPLCGHSEIEDTPNNKPLPISEWSDDQKKSFEEFCEWGRRNCK